MKSYPDCIPCMVSHVLHVCEMNSLDDAKKEQVLRKALKYLAAMDFSLSPPEQARELHAILRRVSGQSDPYCELKDKSTAFAAKLLPELKDKIARRPDQRSAFELALRYAIGGNIIDFGADRHFDLKDARKRLLEVEKMPLAVDKINLLWRKIQAADKIVYILDNCGEAVFDTLLLDFCPEDTTLMVRGQAILNDMTRREVAASGLGNYRIVDSGDATPGISLRFSGPEALDTLGGAEVIIAKGQGNFETLNNSDYPIFFLLRVKCPIIAGTVAAPEGSLQLITHNIK